MTYPNFRVIDMNEKTQIPIAIKRDGDTSVYTYDRLVGSGTFGATYIFKSKGTYPITSDHEVAVKIMKEVGEREDLIKDYLKNMGVSKDGCGLIDVEYLLGLKKGRGFVMEAFHGDMSTFAENNFGHLMGKPPTIKPIPIPSNVMLDMKRQLAKQINCLAEADLYYLDMKPENILWKKEKNGSYIYKIADLGSLMNPDKIADIGSNQTTTYVPPFYVDGFLANVYRGNLPGTPTDNYEKLIWSFYLFAITLIAIRVSTSGEDGIQQVMINCAGFYRGPNYLGQLVYSKLAGTISNFSEVEQCRRLNYIVDDYFPCDHDEDTRQLNLELKRNIFIYYIDKEIYPTLCQGQQFEVSQKRKRRKRKTKTKSRRKSKRKRMSLR